MSEKTKPKDTKETKIMEIIILLASVLAAAVIIYTAYWYVKITRQAQEVVVSQTEELYAYDYCPEENIGYSLVKREVAVSDEEEPEIFEQGYRCVEPVKTVTHELVTDQGNANIYRQYYYSTKLKAETAYENYRKYFKNIGISDNLITIEFN